MHTTPLFTVRDIPVYGDAILAPMTGYSDVPYRALCRAYGSAMHYTEFVPVEALQGKRNRFWQRLETKPGEHPMVFQIFGNNAQKILAAALRIEEELGPDIIDINMGCSTRKVSGRGAGVGMMPQPELVEETFSLLSQHLKIPVTGKIRLGWDDEQRNYAKIARIMEDNGASLIAMHARTKVQKYGGQADWDEIGRLREVVSVPVIGNGDVQVPEDIDRMKAITGCDAVMIGRAAIGNPWIFARRHKSALSFGDIAEAVRIHLHELLAYHGDPFGLILFRKHFKRYIEDFPHTKPFMDEILRTNESERFFEILGEMESSARCEALPA
ncbi:MAG: tRNA-dihydrouridine synthase family protein [Chloroflexota bacterium]